MSPPYNTQRLKEADMTTDKTKAELFLCDGHWNTGEEFYGMVVCSGSWNGKADHVDEGIFYYTDGEPVIGQHSDFVFTTAELMGDYQESDELFGENKVNTPKGG